MEFHVCICVNKLLLWMLVFLYKNETYLYRKRNRETADHTSVMYDICIVARGEEVGRQVGRRLVAGLHHPGDGARIALAADQEDSPLQSKRSSTFS